MGKFTRVSENTFNELQTDAGVIVKSFNPEEPDLSDENIICATTGGINIVCTPTYSDWGSDVDNVPEGTKELQHLDGWECTFGFNALNITPDVIKMALGAADINGNSIIPRRQLKSTDFSDTSWIGDRSDGGLAAATLKNALSTGGFSLQTTKNGKGQLSVTLKGFVSIKDIDKVPMEFYVEEGTETPSETLSDEE